MYDELLQEHKKVKKELSLLQEADVTNRSINANLRFQIKKMEKNLKDVNVQLKKTEKSTEKQIKSLSQYKTQTIETEAKKLLSSVFTKNQLDLILKKKKRVNWSREEISKAFTLRFFSKRSYVYIKNDLNYPLPGK